MAILTEKGMTYRERVHRSTIMVCMAFFILAFFLFMAGMADAARIKEMGYINGARSNQLIGYGLVTGLSGTGDKSNTIFTNQSLANMLETMGIRVDPKTTKVNNVAAVMVTCNLPPFARIGSKIDVTVSSIGDAKSIEGGVLVATPLKGADGQVYAFAQGPMVVGGFLASGQGASVQKNHPTVGRIVNGATIEREVISEEYKGEEIMIALKMPDFTNARRIADRINETFSGIAHARDAGTVNVTIPGEMRGNPVKFLSIVENLDIKTDMQAKIVVDEKTGTVVIGENVRVSTVVISHGNISVQVKEDARVSQPMPFGQGRTVVTPDTQINVREDRGKFYLLEAGISIRELVNALNATGISTRDVITILQTIKASGALHADLEVI
ncbi:MAG: flagellar basal body P-ring protein FlgI [Syntrophorhabdaceae bacterium]|nr:flagellar basal body P-ring protein FlgI [Syntrophorhabdaceae bacterium]